MQTTFNVLTYHAIGDGITNDAPAIQAAIDACTAAGGGTVLLPAGRTYFSGTLQLKSNVELHVERGATLLASGNLADYPPHLHSNTLTNGAVEEDDLPPRAFIIAYQAHRVAISGGGVIDGNGRSFVGEDLGYIYQMAGALQYFQRPFTLFLIGCNHLTMRDITIRDGAFWTLRLTGCEDALIHGIRILNDLKLPNSDAIDLDRCRNVRISDCHIEAGDDAICLKTNRGTAAFGPCENITVTGCTLMTTSSALKLGNESYGPMRNIIFDACIIRSSHRGLSLHLGHPGDIENVIFSNIIIETRLFHHLWWGRGEPIYISAAPWNVAKTGRIRHIRFSNILARSENGVFIQGWEPGLIEDIQLENVRLELDKWSKWPGGRQDFRPCPGGEAAGMPDHPTVGFFINNATNVTLRHCQLVWGQNPPDYFHHALEATGVVTGLTLENFQGESAHPSRYPAIAAPA